MVLNKIEISMKIKLLTEKSFPQMFLSNRRYNTTVLYSTKQITTQICKHPHITFCSFKPGTMKDAVCPCNPLQTYFVPPLSASKENK